MFKQNLHKTNCNIVTGDPGSLFVRLYPKATNNNKHVDIWALDGPTDLYKWTKKTVDIGQQKGGFKVNFCCSL